MPLSERERRILEEIEKNLLEEDPSFAGGLRRRVPAAASSRKVAVGLLALGFALLIGFFVTRNILIGVAAFGTMVAGITLVAASIARGSDGEGKSSSGAADAARRAFARWDEQARKRRKRS